MKAKLQAIFAALVLSAATIFLAVGANKLLDLQLLALALFGLMCLALWWLLPPRVLAWAPKRKPEDPSLASVMRQPFPVWTILFVAVVATAGFYFATLLLLDYRASVHYDTAHESRNFAEDLGLDFKRVRRELNDAVSHGSSDAERKAEPQSVELEGAARVYMAAYLSLPEDQQLTQDDLRLLLDYFNAQDSRPSSAALAMFLADTLNRWSKAQGKNGRETSVHEGVINDYLRKNLASIRTEPVPPNKLLHGLITGNEQFQDITPDTDVSVAVCHALLLRHKKEMEPYRRAHELIASGVIQPLTLLCFFLAVLLLLGRKHTPAIDTKKDNEHSIKQRYVRNLAEQLRPRGRETSSAERLQEAELLLDRIEYKWIEYLMWAMPSLGFIGTVLGVGMALGSADEVVKASTKADQANAISAVTSVLGVAFDTTLVALICLIPAMWLAYRVRTQESRLLLKAAGLARADSEVNGSPTPTEGTP